MPARAGSISRRRRSMPSSVHSSCVPSRQPTRTTTSRSFVKVSIGAGHRDKSSRPQTAVVQTEKANLVFVVDDQGRAQAQTVPDRRRIGADWAIVSGLKAGDRVIVYNLAEGSARRTGERSATGSGYPRQLGTVCRASQIADLRIDFAMSFSSSSSTGDLRRRHCDHHHARGADRLAGTAELRSIPKSRRRRWDHGELPGRERRYAGPHGGAPIEEQLSGSENLIYFSSTASTNGTLTINCTFEVGSNADKR